MSRYTCQWSATSKIDGDGPTYQVIMDFPAFGPPTTVGTIRWRGPRKWACVGRKETYRIRADAAYAAVERFLNARTKWHQSRLKTPDLSKGRKVRTLTPEVANKVWDILVEHWNADEAGRAAFVADQTGPDPAGEWSCGFGKFRHGHYAFGLSMPVNDIRPWSEWVMVMAGERLEALYLREVAESTCVGGAQ